MTEFLLDVSSIVCILLQSFVPKPNRKEKIEREDVLALLRLILEVHKEFSNVDDEPADKHKKIIEKLKRNENSRFNE